MPLFHDKRNGSVNESNPSVTYVVNREMPYGATPRREDKYFSDKKSATMHAKSVSGMGYDTYTTKQVEGKEDKPARGINLKAAATRFFKGR
jgi:hypothetical protein